MVLVTKCEKFVCRSDSVTYWWITHPHHNGVIYMSISITVSVYFRHQNASRFADFHQRFPTRRSSEASVTRTECSTKDLWSFRTIGVHEVVHWWLGTCHLTCNSMYSANTFIKKMSKCWKYYDREMTCFESFCRAFDVCSDDVRGGQTMCTVILNATIDASE
jgi:hypothetical protein